MGMNIRLINLSDKEVTLDGLIEVVSAIGGSFMMYEIYDKINKMYVKRFVAGELVVIYNGKSITLRSKRNVTEIR
jgi:hypothetical protein